MQLNSAAVRNTSHPPRLPGRRGEVWRGFVNDHIHCGIRQRKRRRACASEHIQARGL
jgi:hypothetical protein